MESQIYDWSFKKVDVDQVTINHYKVVSFYEFFFNYFYIGFYHIITYIVIYTIQL